MGSSYSKVAATRARLLRLIEGHDAGTPIPSERDLARAFGVARMTLRRAADELVVAGLVSREQGRGTFVIQPKLAQQMAMASFSEQMRGSGVTPGSEVIEFRRLRGGGSQARALRIPATDPVIRFARLRLADGEPVGLETTWVPANLVPELSQADLAGSWYELLARRYGVQILTGTSVIELAEASDREARILGVPTGTALFHIETTSYGANGRVVDVGVDLFRGDRYRLIAERMSGLSVRPAARRSRLAAAHPASVRPAIPAVPGMPAHRRRPPHREGER
jgi:GntR family transcriptional regulator